MVCIYCGCETEVYNSRERARNPSVWRRRRCNGCVAQFSTYEFPDYETSLAVAGAHGKMYPFRRDKLFLSLYKALGHRSDAEHSATEITATIIGQILRSRQISDGVVHRGVLAQAAHKTLKRYDPLAAHTYKAYHQAALDER